MPKRVGSKYQSPSIKIEDICWNVCVRENCTLRAGPFGPPKNNPYVEKAISIRNLKEIQWALTLKLAFNCGAEK